jgi:hypothetical protein
MIFLVLFLSLTQVKVLAEVPITACYEIRQLDKTGSAQCMTEAEIWALHTKGK